MSYERVPRLGGAPYSPWVAQIARTALPLSMRKLYLLVGKTALQIRGRTTQTGLVRQFAT